MSKVDWYYIYSPRYYPFHYYLQDNINKDIFNLQGIFIEQKVFDKDLYQHEGEHFFSRVTVKVETILKIIKEKMEKNDPTPFYFSDCDILIGNKVDEYFPLYTEYKEVDIVLQQEYTDEGTANPGFMLIWPTEKMLTFWDFIFHEIKDNNKMELDAINEYFKTNNDISWKMFNTFLVANAMTLKSLDYGVYHILCGCRSREQDLIDKYLECKRSGKSMEKYLMMTIEKHGGVFV